MSEQGPAGDDKSAQWWSTAIIDMKPGEIRYRGYAIEELIGNVGLVPMIWLMLRGDLPTKPQAALLDAVRRAQKRYGLNPVGTVGTQTLAALNVPVDHRVAYVWADETESWTDVNGVEVSEDEPGRESVR